MKIGIDARCLEEEKISGVGEYTLRLLENLLEIDSPRSGGAGKKNCYIIFSNSFRKRNNTHFGWFKKHSHVSLKRFSFPNKILNFCFWYFHWPKIDRLIGGVDIFFAPNINFLSVSRNCPLVVTFHDLSFERFPDYFSQKTRIWHEYFVNPRKIAHAADRIIAVSESSRKDLEEIYKIDPENIKIIHHGLSKDFRIIDRNDPKLLAVQKKYSFPHKFILYLGNIEPRKNIHSIISAYKFFISNNPKLKKYKLVLAGNISPLCRNITKEENIITCGYIRREDRPLVYNLASLFVYSSFFEGFGLPVLEAMACGTPVITSNNSSIPEVTGKASLLINPNRPNEIAEALEAVLVDEKLYNEIRERGIKQAQKFSWEKCARKTLSVIASVAKQSRR